MYSRLEEHVPIENGVIDMKIVNDNVVKPSS